MKTLFVQGGFGCLSVSTCLKGASYGRLKAAQVEIGHSCAGNPLRSIRYIRDTSLPTRDVRQGPLTLPTNERNRNA
jgi:hypothetical protein